MVMACSMACAMASTREGAWLEVPPEAKRTTRYGDTLGGGGGVVLKLNEESVVIFTSGRFR